MSVTIASLDELQFGDLGDAIVDELAIRLGYMKDRDAKYLAYFVQLLDDSGIAERLATTGSDGTKSLVGRTRGRQSQLAPYSGKAAPGWLWKQTTADVLDTIKAAQAAGMDTKAYLDATISLVQQSAPTSSPAPVATVAPSGAPKAAKSSRTMVAPAKAALVPVPAAEEPYYARGETDIHPPASFRFWRTVKDYALPLGIVGAGLVATVVIAVLERKKAPAAAGLGGLSSKGCRSVRKRWLAAEHRAHRAKAQGQSRRYRKAERASEKAYEAGQRGGCGWAR